MKIARAKCVMSLCMEDGKILSDRLWLDNHQPKYEAHKTNITMSQKIKLYEPRKNLEILNVLVT